MASIDVDALVFDDENEAKFAAHGLTVEDVQQVLDNRPRYYRNLPGRRASHVMLGPTFDGEMLVVPLELYEDALWRPVTAFPPTRDQVHRYRSRR